jgi:hypothetical protein
MHAKGDDVNGSLSDERRDLLGAILEKYAADPDYLKNR